MEILTLIVENVEHKSVITKHGTPRHDRHISNEDIAAFVDKKLLARKRRAVMLHLVTCEKCRRIVSAVVVSQAEVKDPIE